MCASSVCNCLVFIWWTPTFNGTYLCTLFYDGRERNRSMNIIAKSLHWVHCTYFHDIIPFPTLEVSLFSHLKNLETIESMFNSRDHVKLIEIKWPYFLNGFSFLWNVYTMFWFDHVLIVTVKINLNGVLCDTKSHHLIQFK